MNPSQTATRNKSGPQAKSGRAFYVFSPDGVSFRSVRAASVRLLYFPLCGTDSTSLKSAITPCLGGDIKIDKTSYLTKPVSREDLRSPLRDFFCYVKGRGVMSLAGGTGGSAAIEVGMLWHKLSRTFKDEGLSLEAVNFIPTSGENAELMRVTVKNTGKQKIQFTPTFCLPLFARSLANKHDHEHVTSLLHRIEQLSNGVCVTPTMIFNERGHRPNERCYFVLGTEGDGTPPSGSFPTAEHFYGDGGSAAEPEAVFGNTPADSFPPEALAGKEAVGALRFADKTLAAGETAEYLFIYGIASGREDMEATFRRFNSTDDFTSALAANRKYWEAKTGAIGFSTGDRDFNAWMRWVTLQPVLRRIFGCSFLPDHDYGKGGKGWRDLWQDLLSLILIEPGHVREQLVNNFAGVRIDGSNATIIGAAPGEFLADRNFISRVWMDHGAWPFLTLLLYINQTGDTDILFEESAYFRDVQLSRSFEKDFAWTAKNGNFLNDKNVKIYRGSILEHILIQHLVQFFNVGEHNITKLEDADWNDGLDMAGERGESVAFAAFYGGNMLALADLLEHLSGAQGINKISLAEEVMVLLDTLTDNPVDYDDARAKEAHLFETYFPSVQPQLSGNKVMVPVDRAVEDLRKKGRWIFRRIKTHEKITVDHKGKTYSWFNGYYDNKGERVEGAKGNRLRMTLPGQVFAVMSGLADADDVADVTSAVNAHLRDKNTGGIRLNSDFTVPHYMDLGRAFGFAYGTKENGAFFSHMTVMYAYALYKRGFVREGHDVIRSIYKMCTDTEKSRIYPGIPEYFDSSGRGYYHYLTGAASWLVLTELTQVFGVRGDQGDLLIEPKLMAGQFDAKTFQASVNCTFSGKRITVTYKNPAKLDYGSYTVKGAFFNDKPAAFTKTGPGAIRIKRTLFESMPSDSVIRVELAPA